MCLNSECKLLPGELVNSNAGCCFLCAPTLAADSFMEGEELQD